MPKPLLISAVLAAYMLDGVALAQLPDDLNRHVQFSVSNAELPPEYDYKFEAPRLGATWRHQTDGTDGARGVLFEASFEYAQRSIGTDLDFYDTLTNGNTAINLRLGAAFVAPSGLYQVTPYVAATHNAQILRMSHTVLEGEEEEAADADAEGEDGMPTPPNSIRWKGSSIGAGAGLLVQVSARPAVIFLDAKYLAAVDRVGVWPEGKGHLHAECGVNFSLGKRGLVGLSYGHFEGPSGNEDSFRLSVGWRY